MLQSKDIEWLNGYKTILHIYIYIYIYIYMLLTRDSLQI